jgi:hypothetical protein
VQSQLLTIRVLAGAEVLGDRRSYHVNDISTFFNFASRGKMSAFAVLEIAFDSGFTPPNETHHKAISQTAHIFHPRSACTV